MAVAKKAPAKKALKAPAKKTKAAKPAKAAKTVKTVKPAKKAATRKGSKFGCKAVRHGRFRRGRLRLRNHRPALLQHPDE